MFVLKSDDAIKCTKNKTGKLVEAFFFFSKMMFVKTWKVLIGVKQAIMKIWRYSAHE